MTLHVPSQTKLIEGSVVERDGSTYALVRTESGARCLLVRGATDGFAGDEVDGGLLCSLTPGNAETLRSRLPWLQPVALGTRISAGFGDRLGIATPGHVAAVRGSGVAPIFAQQSVRENERTGRSPQEVVDDAMWGVLQAGWREPWGADADHMKTVADIPPFVAAGYTFFTIDPGDHVDDEAESAPEASLQEKVAGLPWDEMESSAQEMRRTYAGAVTLDDRTLTFDEATLFKAAAKYGRALAHTVTMARQLAAQMGERAFDLEMSVDETHTTTSLHEHFYIVSELHRLGVEPVSIAPRFVGRFEKGVDYIGDLDALDRNIAGHAAIMRHFGNRYKLSLHTGSDKFGVYPIAVAHTGGLVHLKTAGTSYLEALRVMAVEDSAFFRRILDFARGRYAEDRRSYHVSAELGRVPAAADLGDDELPALLEDFHARQVLHVTFGSVLDTYGEKLHDFLNAHESEYHAALKQHFDRHIAPFARG